MNEKYLRQEIDSLKEIVKKLANYIKVTDYENYRRVNQHLIDYDALDYLKTNQWLREQLEYDHRMMIRARINDDFLEFCRYANLQIELMIDVFIKVLEERQEIEVERGEYNELTKIIKDTKEYKGTNWEKLNFCLDLINLNENINIKDTIIKVMKIRNIASHRDCILQEDDDSNKKIIRADIIKRIESKLK